MSFKPNAWEPKFLPASTTPWRCSLCDRGALVADKNLIVARTAVEAERARGDENYEPDWEFKYFGGLLRCNNSDCGEFAAVAGVTNEEPIWDEQHGQGFQTYFIPKFIAPAPTMITLPDVETVAEQLRVAFGLYWSDPSACGNRLRSAIETALNHLKVPRSTKGKNGKLSPLTLHYRLEHYKKLNPEVADILLAIKWLGNAASHATLTRQDVVDGFTLLDHAFSEMFAQRSKRIKKLAAAIRRQKGPRRR